MKSLYFLLSVAVVQGFLLTSSGATQIPKPTLKPYSLLVKWNKVVNPDESDPVLGYLVTVWKLLEETGNAGTKDSIYSPVGKPKVYSVEGADTIEFLVENIEQKVFYSTGVQAYTMKEKGPVFIAPVMQVMG